MRIKFTKSLRSHSDFVTFALIIIVMSYGFRGALFKYVSIPYSFGIFWTSFWASFCYKRRKNGQDQFGIWPTREKSTYVHVQWQHVTNPTSTWALIISNPPVSPHTHTRARNKEVEDLVCPYTVWSFHPFSDIDTSSEWEIHEISSAFATILLRTHLASTLNWNYWSGRILSEYAFLIHIISTQ